ncbi:MAG: hypothetical protein IH786_10490 [Proteobacteria bacterium]|nr:hypothetical protein [Pseudomonadota bacterium]
MERLSKWPQLTPAQVAEMVHVLCHIGSEDALAEIAKDRDLFAAPVPALATSTEHAVQGHTALFGLSLRLVKLERTEAFDSALLQALRSVVPAKSQFGTHDVSYMCGELFGDEDYVPARAEDWPEFAALARRLALRQRNVIESREGVDALLAFAERLESRMAEGGQAKGKAVSDSKKKPKRRKAP